MTLRLLWLRSPERADCHERSARSAKGAGNNNLTKTGTRNPKHEIQNSKQIRNSNVQNVAKSPLFQTFVLWICFEFRISCFGFDPSYLINLFLRGS